MSFDDVIDRVGTHCAKWDMMEHLYGVSPQDGLAMWVADMDFRPPEVVRKAVQKMADHGVFGYFGDDAKYRAAIGWWMETRHGWTIEPDWIFTTHGLVNGTALCIDAFTEAGDGVALFTPVYHAFHRIIRAAGREIVELPLVDTDGRYEMDFSAYDELIGPRTRMVILCSPHNPGGRVWTRAELEGLAAFCKRHDLLLVSDEIHHDLVFPGNRHIPMGTLDPGLRDRLVVMTATTKTFNIAGSHIGNVIIEDKGLRDRFAARIMAHGISPNSFGVMMATAAYSPEGAAWVDDLVRYLDGNRRVFDEGINAIPGLRAMPLEATYLAWVDFSGTGMEPTQYLRRVEKDARIAVNHGEPFGVGGEHHLRFNFGTTRARVEEAVARMQRAFGDLQ